METYVQTERKPAYGWAALALLATAALCLIPEIRLPAAAGAESERDLMNAIAAFDTFFLRAALLVPLLCVTPALWARCAHRTHPLSLAVLTFSAFAFGFLFARSALTGLYCAGLIAPAGVLLYGMQRMRLSNFKVVFYSSLALLFGLFLRFCVPTLAENGDAFLPMRETVEAYRVVWNAGTAELAALDVNGLIAPILETVSSMLLSWKLDADQYLIQILYYPSAVAALSNGLLSYAFNRKGGADLVPLKPFSEWTAEPTYFFAAAIFSAASYGMMFLNVPFAPALVRIAYTIWMMPMGLVGLCTLKKWTKRRPWIFALICVGCGLMFSVAVQALPLVGTVGFLTDRMRQRNQGGNR